MKKRNIRVVLFVSLVLFGGAYSSNSLALGQLRSMGPLNGQTTSGTSDSTDAASSSLMTMAAAMLGNIWI